MNNNEKFKINYWIMLNISVWLGFLGIDRLIRKNMLGIPKLFTFGGCGIWWLIDIILYATKTMPDIEYEDNNKNIKIGGIIFLILTILCATRFFYEYNSNNQNNQSEEQEVRYTIIPTESATNTPVKTKMETKLIPKNTPTPKTPKPTKKHTPKPTLYIDSSITFDNLSRNPDDFFGSGVVFTGKIIQVIEGKNETDYRIAIGNDYNKVMLIAIEKESLVIKERLLENDIIRFQGISMGLYTYTSGMNIKITVPLVVVTKIVSRQ